MEWSRDCGRRSSDIKLDSPARPRECTYREHAEARRGVRAKSRRASRRSDKVQVGSIRQDALLSSRDGCQELAMARSTRRSPGEDACCPPFGSRGLVARLRASGTSRVACRAAESREHQVLPSFADRRMRNIHSLLRFARVLVVREKGAELFPARIPNPERQDFRLRSLGTGW